MVIEQQFHADSAQEPVVKSAAEARAAVMLSSVISGRPVRMSSRVIPEADQASMSQTVMRIILMNGLRPRLSGSMVMSVR